MTSTRDHEVVCRDRRNQDWTTEILRVNRRKGVNEREGMVSSSRRNRKKNKTKLEGEMTSRLLLGYNFKCQESHLRKRLKSKALPPLITGGEKESPGIHLSLPFNTQESDHHLPWIAKTSLIIYPCLIWVPSKCADSYITFYLPHLISLRLSVSSILALTVSTSWTTSVVPSLVHNHSNPLNPQSVH